MTSVHPPRVATRPTNAAIVGSGDDRVEEQEWQWVTRFQRPTRPTVRTTGGAAARRTPLPAGLEGDLRRDHGPGDEGFEWSPREYGRRRCPRPRWRRPRTERNRVHQGTTWASQQLLPDELNRLNSCTGSGRRIRVNWRPSGPRCAAGWCRSPGRRGR